MFELILLPAVIAFVQPAETNRPIEATSLLGKSLHRLTLEPVRRAQFEDALALAKSDFDKDPFNEQSIIWLGRRTAYLGAYNDAIAIYSKGLEELPQSYRLLRHRGHRYITIRKFDLAVADLSKAAELIQGTKDQPEPDGMPNPLGIPVSTDHSNIYYHLGLAHYLTADYEKAAEAFSKRAGLAAANDDTLSSTTHWRYLALRRAGKHEEAEAALEPINQNLKVIENDGYFRLCLMYKGLATPESTLKRDDKGRIADPAIAYGVAAFVGLRGDKEHAQKLMEEIAAVDNWPAFGVIAAEADLARDHERP